MGHWGHVPPKDFEVNKEVTSIVKKMLLFQAKVTSKCRAPKFSDASYAPGNSLTSCKVAKFWLAVGNVSGGGASP